MGFLRRLLGGANGDVGAPLARTANDAEWRVAAEATFDAHVDRSRVSVWLRLTNAAFEDGREQQRVFALENRVMRTLEDSAAGEHDTNTLEPGFFAMRLIGDDADAIVAAIQHLLVDAPPGSYLAVRRGPAGSPEERIDLPAPPGP